MVTVSRATDITPDGSVIVGRGTTPSGQNVCLRWTRKDGGT
jgi:hypothetical protein